jgi:squalene synthase HpnC
VTRAEDVVANASGENFPVALRILPARHRRHLTNLYFFARLTDDLGDEVRGGWGDGESPHEQGGSGGDRPPEIAEDITQLRLHLLDELAADVDRIYSGKTPQSPVIKAMAETVRACDVPAKPLLDLIQANRQDQLVSRYRTYPELEQYCELSANPVGQIVLHIFGVATPRRIALSDSICTALQLAEHWQDVAEDLASGRIYLPGEDLERFGVTEADLAAPSLVASSAGRNVKQLMIFETDRAGRLLDSGAPLVHTLHGAARLAVAGYLAGGRAALAAIRGQDYDVLRGTPRPRKQRLAAELVSAYVKGR